MVYINRNTYLRIYMNITSRNIIFQKKNTIIVFFDETIFAVIDNKEVLIPNVKDWKKIKKALPLLLIQDDFLSFNEAEKKYQLDEKMVADLPTAIDIVNIKAQFLRAIEKFRY